MGYSSLLRFTKGSSIMKKPVIGRYELTEDREVIIDVSVKNVSQLYSNFDKASPYHKKEFEQEFADYLIECVREVRNSPFVVRISLDQMPDQELILRVQKSFDNYFIYLKELEKRSLNRLFKRTVILSCVGFVLFVLSIQAAKISAASGGVMHEVFAQGLTVAAWVSLWEAIANLFLEIRPLMSDIKLFSRIVDAPILFKKHNNKVAPKSYEECPNWVI